MKLLLSSYSHYLIVFILLPWKQMARPQDIQVQGSQLKNNHRRRQQQQQQQQQHLLHRQLSSTPPYEQFTIDEFLNPPEVQQDVLLHIRASPLELSAQDLTAIENEFQNAYNRQQYFACGAPGVNFYPIIVKSCEILVNATTTTTTTTTDKEVIDGFGDEPRSIAAYVDFSFIMVVSYACLGCKGNFNYTLFDDNVGVSYYYDSRASYQASFPSSLVPCSPSQPDVIADLGLSGFISTVDGLQFIYSADPIPTNDCNDLDFSPFSSYFTIAVEGDYNVPNFRSQIELAQQAIVEVYNELNVLNPFTCDFNSRITTSASVTVVDPKAGLPLRRSRRLNNGKYLYSWFFLYAELGGECYGCPTGSCLTNDVSGYETCGIGSRRRLTNNNIDGGWPCFCIEENANEALPTNEDFRDALEERFEILRNETSSFTLVDDIVYSIEIDVPDSCCGWPVNGNIPVDVDGADFRTAVTSYINTGTSPYGFPINCWDVSNVTDMTSAFQLQTDFNEPLSCWDTSKVTTMQFMLRGTSSFNQDISQWDTSRVTNMYWMFHSASVFNQDLSQWDTSSVTTMQGAFTLASSFDQDLSNWDTSKVTILRNMFSGASNFNGDVSSWNISQCTDTRYMFEGAINFNGDLSGWDMSKVTRMNSMFDMASSFNGDISMWDTSKVRFTHQMFSSASNFNIDISNWDIGQVEDTNEMFLGATSFNIDISGWDVTNLQFPDDMFNGATQFRQDLCQWEIVGINIDYAYTTNMFVGTNCPNTADPVENVGPWCFTC